MAKESIYSIGKEPIFRETFNDQQAVERNGNYVYIPDVNSFIEGRCYLDGLTTNVNIVTPITSGQTYSFRFKCKINDITPSSSNYLCDYRKSNPTYLSWSPGSLLGAAGSSVSATYINSNVTNDLTGYENKWIEVIFSGFNSTYDLLVGTVGRFYNDIVNSSIDFELIEIYEGELTAEEITNLYKISRYQELNKVPILNLTAESGIIEDKAGNSFTNTDVTVVRDGQIYVNRCNGTTSTINLGSSISLGTVFSFFIWVKLKYKGTYHAFAGYNNSSYPLLYLDTTDSLFVHDGTGAINVNNIGYDLKNWGFLGCTKNGVTVNFYLNGIKVGTNNFASENSLTIDRLYQRNSGLFLKGEVGPVYIFNSIISDGYISSLYTSTKFKYTG